MYFIRIFSLIKNDEFYFNFFSSIPNKKTKVLGKSNSAAMTNKIDVKKKKKLCPETNTITNKPILPMKASYTKLSVN